MIEFIAILSVGGLGVGYFVRLEKQISEIKTDLDWIKEYIHKCQQP